MNNTPLAVLCAAVSLGALLAGLAGHAAPLGMGAVLLVVLLALTGLRTRSRTSVKALATIGAFGVAFGVLIALAYQFHDPSAPLRMIGGFPAGTAMLVYGIAPLGMTLGVLYCWVFDREVLHPDKQREFLRRFSGK